MVQVVSSLKGTGTGTEESAALVKPLMDLIRMHVDELEPLFRSLDQRAYEKGFEDGRDVGFPKAKNPIEFTKAPASDATALRSARGTA
ncbi:hypothetical protein [Caballeronia fortuita]|nr:hypothetical protein [Caballeronia fortuita]